MATRTALAPQAAPVAPPVVRAVAEPAALQAEEVVAVRGASERGAPRAVVAELGAPLAAPEVSPAAAQRPAAGVAQMGALQATSAQGDAVLLASRKREVPLPEAAGLV